MGGLSQGDGQIDVDERVLSMYFFSLLVSVTRR